MRGIGPFLKDAWQLARPYFMTSEEKWSARGLLAAIIAMRLSIVGLTVVLSFWRAEFYNALQDKDWKAFVELLLYYRRTDGGIMPGFVVLSGVWIGLFVLCRLRDAVPADPLAPLADPRIPAGMAGRPRLLPDQPDDG